MLQHWLIQTFFLLFYVSCIFFARKREMQPGLGYFLSANKSTWHCCRCLVHVPFFRHIHSLPSLLSTRETITNRLQMQCCATSSNKILVGCEWMCVESVYENSHVYMRLFLLWPHLWAKSYLLWQDYMILCVPQCFFFMATVFHNL